MTMTDLRKQGQDALESAGTGVTSAYHAVGDTVGGAIEAVTDTTGRVVRGTVAGLIAGAIASWVMNQYQEIENRPVSVRRNQPDPAEKNVDGEDATVKAAQAVSSNLLDRELTEDEKKAAGPAVHYTYGALVGGLYGGLTELIPSVGMGLGIPYATALWLAGDEVAVPKLGLSKKPSEVPVSGHASALASHFVYGISLDLVRRVVKHLV